MIRASGGTVTPAQVLGAVSSGKAIQGLSSVLLDRIDGLTGTPDAKIRIGVTTAVDYASWTCTCEIAGSPLAVPNVQVMAEVVPYVGRKYLILQIGPEYVVLGHLGALFNQPRGRLLISSGSLASSTSYSAVNWTDNVYLEGITGGAATNNLVLTVPGEYELVATVAMAVSATGFRALQIREQTNSSGLVNYYLNGNATNAVAVNHRMEISIKRKLSIGDDLIVEAAQNSGAALTYHIGALDNNSFTAHRIGPL